MKANELRIGNLVDLGNRIAKVTEINHLSCVVVDLEETQDTIEDYERTRPILLTEEWLLKFGFEWKGNKFLTIFTPCGKALVYIGDNFFKFSGITIEIQIKYVHQLQNLYFALTGEELVIK